MMMKRMIALICCIACLVPACFCLSGCADERNTTSIQFEKKYIRDYRSTELTSQENMEWAKENRYEFYIFYSNNTGYYEEKSSSTDDDIYHYRIDFIWKTADDGSTHLFQTAFTALEDHTVSGGRTSMRIPLLFGEDFLIQQAGNRVRYIVEGSDLAKALKYE